MDITGKRTEYSSFEREAMRLGPASPVEPSGFVENWGEALRLDIDEETSLSRIVNYELFTERRNKLMQLYDSGSIDKETIDSFSFQDPGEGYTIIDWEKLGQWANGHLGTDFKTDEEINEYIRDDLKLKRELAQETFSRANWYGKAGQLAGSMHAAMLDPALWPTFFIGLGAAAKGTSYLSRFGRAAGAAALTEGSFEALRQPMIFNWKKNIGAEYNFSDAFATIAGAALGAGVITGSAQAMSDGLGRVLRWGRNDKISNEARRVVENYKREVDQFPDQDGPVDVQTQRLEGEVQRQEGLPREGSREIVSEKEPIYEAEIPEEDLDEIVSFETLEGDIVQKSVRDAIDEMDSLQNDVEIVKKCLS